MKTKTKVPKNPRGKPKGTRSQRELYDKILGLLKQDKEDKGDGMTAFAISKALAISDPTIRMYCQDLLKEKCVTSKKMLNAIVYRFKKDREI